MESSARKLRASTPRGETLACYYVLAPAEASSNLARYDGIRYGDFTPVMSREEFLNAGDFNPAAKAERRFDQTRRRAAVGAFALSSERAAEYFEKAQTFDV